MTARNALHCLVLAAALAACGSPARPAGPKDAPGLPPITAQPAAPDDPIVARVDGRPVFGSCVATQAAALHLDAKAALDQCVGFELLAGAAAARGAERAPEVQRAYRTALVSRLIEREFSATHRRPADLPPEMVEAAFDHYKWRMHRPEYRYAVFVRAPLEKDKVPPPEKEAAARQLAFEIYDRVKDRTDLFPSDLRAAAHAVAGDRTVEDNLSPYGTGKDGPGHTTFTGPLFAIPAIGQVAPPARTPWGWDVILWVDTMPALESSRDDVIAWLFPALRSQLFLDWSNRVAQELRLPITVDPTPLEAIAEPDTASPPPTPGRR
ncbi:MAG: hypothetical protein K8W52_29730 [Deltaproteobacteria bacterium]|nr:hypothetical protein [Deltaproteobacteria bacterium]